MIHAAAAAAAAKSLQSCPTLCNPTDVSPPGSPIPGILQARTLEWVAISFSKSDTYSVLKKIENLPYCTLFLFPPLGSQQKTKWPISSHWRVVEGRRVWQTRSDPWPQGTDTWLDCTWDSLQWGGRWTAQILSFISQIQSQSCSLPTSFVNTVTFYSIPFDFYNIFFQ